MPDLIVVVPGVTAEGLDTLRKAADMLTQSGILAESAHKLLREIRELGEFSMIGHRIPAE